MARERASLADLKPKPRNDAYTVLLTISLVAMIGACLLLWYDLKRFGDKLQPPKGYSDVARPVAPEAPGVDERLPVIPPPTPPGGGAEEKKEPEKNP
jgi:hypothetical protein